MSTGLVSLDHDPRYTIDAFVDELLSRARTTIADLGPKLETLVHDMCESLRTFQEAHYLITMSDIRFEEVTWLRESGKLAIRFGLGKAPEADGARHVVVDEFIDGVMQRNVPLEFRDECAGFMRGFVMQLSLLHKTGLVLREVSFDRPLWHGKNTMLIQIRHNERPLLPRDVGVM